MNIKQIHNTFTTTILIFATVFIGILSVPKSTLAESVCTKSTRLNVRSSASTSSQIVWKLYKGSYVNVVGYNSNYTWAKIKFWSGDVEKIGWINASYICN
jgi:uncharacterized protein YgiM (DUF1202 family)